MAATGFQTHDHNQCVSSAVAEAQVQCAERKLQLTPVRVRVLEILLSEHKALGAYDILAILGAERLGSQPPVAYRALDFLVVNGFAHKIESLNAYVACAHPGEAHAPAFMICRSCDAVAEASEPIENVPLEHAAVAAGFEIERTVLEVEGLCPAAKVTNNDRSSFSQRANRHSWGAHGAQECRFCYFKR